VPQPPAAEEEEEENIEYFSHETELLGQRKKS